MDLRTYLRILRRRYRLVALIAVICVGLAVVKTASAANVYVSPSTLFVSAQDNSSADNLQSNLSGELLVQQRVKSYADILQSPRLAELVAQDLNVPLAQVSGHISADVPLDTVLLKVSATSTDPKLAQRIAADAATRFASLIQQIERPESGGPPPIKISVTQPALLPTGPSSPKPATNLVLGLLIGLALGVGAAVGREALDTRVQGHEQAEDLVGAPVLGAIAADRRSRREPLIVHAAPSSVRAESFRTLRTNLQFVDVDFDIKSVVITSAVAGEGKSTTSCNLAISLAQAGARVILVEADLRRPKVAEYMGLEGAIGLTTALTGQAELDDVLQPWGQLPLQVLASGQTPPNPSELLGSARMEYILHELESRADIVIIDAPPILPVTDAAVLGAVAGGVIMVVAADTARRDQVKRASAGVRSVGGHILGTVLNRVPPKGNDAYYGEAYYGSAVAAPRQRTPESADVNA